MRPSNQRAFNEKSARAYLNNDVDRKVTRMEPPKLLPSGCQPENIGLGALHMHAPHLELGFPMPPCPRCGWKSVDKNKVSSNGLCPARRVYAPEKDEWVGGLTMRCGLCYDAKQKAKSRRDIVKEDEYSTEEEIAAAEATVKAATYYYRSYNPRSIEIYAERYSFWVESLEYVILNRRTAIVRLLARRIARSCTKGSNLTDLAEELKTEMFERAARFCRYRRQCMCLYHTYSYVRFTVRRELEMTGVRNSSVILILITLSDDAPKHPEAP